MNDESTSPSKTGSSKMMTILPWLGWVGFLLSVTVFTMAGCSTPKTMNEQAITYKEQLSKFNNNATSLFGEQEKQALENFSNFLKGIGSKDYINAHIENAYAKDSYLNDTLKSLHGREEIRQHFLKTSETMKSYELVIDDVTKSGNGYYIRWTMIFSAPKLASGKPIESIGISHVLFDSDGRVLLHQDFWDSTSGLFEHVPVVGGGIRFVKKRL